LAIINKHKTEIMKVKIEDSNVSQWFYCRSGRVYIITYWQM